MLCNYVPDEKAKEYLEIVKKFETLKEEEDVVLVPKDIPLQRLAYALTVPLSDLILRGDKIEAPMGSFSKEWEQVWEKAVAERKHDLIEVLNENEVNSVEIAKQLVVPITDELVQAYIPREKREQMHKRLELLKQNANHVKPNDFQGEYEILYLVLCKQGNIVLDDKKLDEKLPGMKHIPRDWKQAYDRALKERRQDLKELQTARIRIWRDTSPWTPTTKNIIAS